MSNLAHFPKDKDSSISTVWPFAFRSRWGCSQGAQTSDLWENIHQQYLQMWKTASLVSPGSYMLLLTLRRFVSQLEVVFLLLVDRSLNYTLRSKTSVTNELFMKTQVTYFLWWLAVRGEQSNLPRGILEALFNTVMGGLIWATYIFTVKWEAGENTSLLRNNCKSGSLNKPLGTKHNKNSSFTGWYVSRMGVTWWLDSLWDFLQAESSNHHYLI